MKGMRPLPPGAVRIDDACWNRYTNLITDVVLPYQWDILNDRVPDAPPSYCLENFRIAAGEAAGERKGPVFQDSDAAKWLEAVAYSLTSHPDPALEKTADDVIALIGRAQEADGYLNTYYSIVEKGRRWTNLTEGHELYCAGHFIEAAVAYYEATGKDSLLAIVRRFADLVCGVFGPGKDQIHGYPGHPEIELALVKLFRTTGERRYLDLAKYFVDTRGQTPNYFLEEMARPGFHLINPDFARYDPEYSQSHLPVRSQESAEGHAVRAMYLYCAMADLAEEYGDETLLKQCALLWKNITEKRMYITGSIGSSGFWERFTTDYDLPNDSNYSETCASIVLALFGIRMARITRDGSYIDGVERALYNTVRSGISLEGNRYFYVNPLEVWPHNCMEHTSRAHINPVRQKWFDVACCPTNIARTFTFMGQYIYAAGKTGDDPFELCLNLFIQNDAVFEADGRKVEFSVRTDYPRTGKARLFIKAPAILFALNIRVPGFAGRFAVKVNSGYIKPDIQKGYCRIVRTWNDDEVSVEFDITPRLVYANPLVRANAGKTAIVRGPEVYCFEEADNGQGLASLCLESSAELREEWRDDILGGAMLIRCRGKKLVTEGEASSFTEKKPRFEDIELTAVPYGLWCNRKPGEMIVWVHLLPE
jgi:DUF1680 family protein